MTSHPNKQTPGAVRQIVIAGSFERAAAACGFAINAGSPERDPIMCAFAPLTPDVKDDALEKLAFTGIQADKPLVMRISAGPNNVFVDFHQPDGTLHSRNVVPYRHASLAFTGKGAKNPLVGEPRDTILGILARTMPNRHAAKG